MPHLTLEYTTNLTGFPVESALVALNQAMLASGLFTDTDIKSRAIALEHFRVGQATAGRAFIHVRVALLAGRSPEARKALADALLAALTPTVNSIPGTEIQLSVETTELDRPSYAKAVLHGH